MQVNIVQTPGFTDRRADGYLSYPSRIASGVFKRGIKVNLYDPPTLIKMLKNDKFLPDETGEVLHFRSTLPRKHIEDLTTKGFICVNSAEAVYNSMDKIHSQMLAKANDIPIAPTHEKLLLSESSNIKKELADIMDLHSWSSCVIKPNFSSGNGANVWKIDRNEIEQFDIKRFYRAKFWVVQKCISYDRIIRTILHGGELVQECVTYDQPLPGGWKCTVCINPHMKYEPNPTDELKKFVEKVCGVIKADDPGIAYIDVFETSLGYVYGETNLNCTLEQHEQVTGFPVYQHKADYLISLLQNR